MLNTIEISDNEDGTFTLIRPLKFLMHTVPKGFKTDFASVPSVLHWFVVPYGKHSKASVLHDWLYHTIGNNKQYTRYQCDRLFLIGLLYSDVPVWRSIIMFCAVRLCGWIPWNKYKNQHEI